MSTAERTTGTDAPWWLLVVEAAPRWAPAARFALTRRGRLAAARRVGASEDPAPLERLGSCSQPVAVGLSLGVDRHADGLKLLSRLRQSRSLCPVALLEPKLPAALRAPLSAACREAGAAAVLASPLAVDELLTIGDRHADRVWSAALATMPPTERRRLRLPWQSAPWAIG